MSWHQKVAIAVLLLIAIVSLILFVRDWRRAGRRRLAESMERRVVPLSRSSGEREPDRGSDE
jgi:hypothetical protein